MRSLPPYPAYRPSSVQWLGDLPEHWSVARLGDVAELVNGFPFDSDLFDPGEGVPLIRIRDLFTLETEVRWAGDPVQQAEIGDGDILIGMDGDFNVAWWRQGRALLNQRLCCVRAQPAALEQRFAFYCLPCPLKALNDVTYATTVKHLSSIDVLKFRLPLPPLDEQRAIATFLDRETERIDALVAKKRQLVERLQEYRTALITRTVTRGLPPDAARAAGLDPSPHLKPSGVEWLGDVPEHWEVKRLEHVAAYRTSNVDKKTEEGELPVRLCNYTDVYYGERIRAGEGDFMEATASPREVARFKLVKGDVLVTKDSEDWRDIAVPALIEETADDFVCGYHLGIIRPSSSLEPAFLLRVMQSVAVNQQLQTSASGVTRYGLPNSAVGETVVPVPPLTEQRAIGIFLDSQTKALVEMSERAETAIERLQEYRTALITAAVTGKIDVRESATTSEGPAE